MAGFLLIVGFPLVLFAGFGSAQMTRRMLGVRASDFDRWSIILYPTFLLVPLAAAWPTGLELERWLRPGATGGAGLALEISVVLVVGIVTGFLLFEHELHWARWAAARTDRTGLSRPGDRRTAEFVEAQQHLPWVALLPISAAVVWAEEVLWRGCLITFLERRFDIPMAGGVVLAALSFGFNHGYFGIRQILLKALSALVWGAMFVSTGSLLLPLVSHATFEYRVWRRMRT